LLNPLLIRFVTLFSFNQGNNFEALARNFLLFFNVTLERIINKKCLLYPNPFYIAAVVQAVVEGGAAWQDGRLEAGDQLLAVDGHSLEGITQVRHSPGLGTGQPVR
jgi:hypothetical protein